MTAARLAATTGPLVEIHGQNDQQRLLDERWQRDLLDAFGADAARPDRRPPRRLGAGAANRDALAELELDPRELTRRLELLEHETAEIAGCTPAPGRIGRDPGAGWRPHSMARRSPAAAAELRTALAGEPSGARETLAGAGAAARSLARLDPRWEPVAERLSGLEAEVGDLADGVRDLTETVDHDPAELARLEERLSLIFGLFRRYGDDEQAVLDHAARAAGELERLHGLDLERSRRAVEDVDLLETVAEAAAALSARRHSAAIELAQAVSPRPQPTWLPR